MSCQPNFLNQHRMSGIELREWYEELSRLPGRQVQPSDPQWLWNVYVSEWMGPRPCLSSPLPQTRL